MFNTARHMTWLLICCGIIGTLHTACTDHTVPQQPLQTCRITSIVSGSGKQFWEYNADGQPKSYRSTGNTLSEYNGQINYTYDADQLLTTSINANSNGAVVSRGTFDYTNNRLTKWIVKNPSGDILVSRTFDYDGSGNLGRYIDIYQLGKDTYSFSGGKLTAHTIERIDANGNLLYVPETYTYENGRRKISYITGRSESTSFTYDAQGRTVRSETKNADTLSRYYISEYTDGKSVYDAYTLPKGWPHELRYYPDVYHEYLQPDETGKPGLLTKGIGYGVPLFLIPTTKKISEEINIYIKNSNGFPVEKNSVSQGETYFGNFNNVIITPYKYTSNTTYTYTGCE